MSIPHVVSCLSLQTLQTLPVEMTDWPRALELRSNQVVEDVLGHLTAMVVAVLPAAVGLLPLEVAKLKPSKVNLRPPKLVVL